MSKNILDLSNIETNDLMDELNRRGWKTELLFGLSDVDMQLESINEGRDEESQITLSDDNKGEILDQIFDSVGYYIEQINNEIEDKILNYE
jgi:hypothetical protein